MSLHIVCILFQLTKRTALHGSVDDPLATDPGGAATDSSKHKVPTIAQLSTGAADPQVNAHRGDATDNSNRDSLPVVSTGADDPRVNDPRGVATESANKKLRPTILVSTDADDHLVTAQRGGAIEDWMLHLSTCRHTTVLVATAGAVTMATDLVTATDGAVSHSGRSSCIRTRILLKKISLCSKQVHDVYNSKRLHDGELCCQNDNITKGKALRIKNCSNRIIYGKLIVLVKQYAL